MYDKPLEQLREEIDVNNTGLRPEFVSPRVYGFLRTYDNSKGDNIANFVGTPQTDFEFQYAATALKTAQMKMVLQKNDRSYQKDFCALTTMLDGGLGYFDNKTAFLKIPIKVIKSGIDYKKILRETGLDADYIHGTPIPKIAQDLREDGIEYNGELTEEFIINRLGVPTLLDDKIFMTGIIYLVTGVPSTLGRRDPIAEKLKTEVTLDTAVQEELTRAIGIFTKGEWRKFRF